MLYTMECYIAMNRSKLHATIGNFINTTLSKKKPLRKSTYYEIPFVHTSSETGKADLHGEKSG
jgi:hypothetical protein